MFEPSMSPHERKEPAGPSGTRGPDRLAVLDGLRGLAILVVLASHYSSAGLFPKPALHGVGKSGVYLFFVLSAYLLARNLLHLPPAALRQGRTWQNYALRRVLRIWPLYLVVLLVSWATHGQAWSVFYEIDTGSLWRHLTLAEGRSVLWSIPVEFKFYLVLPFLVLLLVAIDRWRGTAQVAVFVGLVAAVAWAWPPAQSPENGVGLGAYLAVFLCGTFAARIDQWLRRDATRTGAWTAMGMLAVACWVVTVPVLWCQLTGKAFDATVSRSWYMFFGVLWSVLLLSALHGRGWLVRWLASRPMRWVGMVSFSLYLWHMPILNALLRTGLAGSAPYVAPLAVLVASLAGAWVSWRLLERPFQDVRLAPAPAPQPGAGA